LFDLGDDESDAIERRVFPDGAFGTIATLLLLVVLLLLAVFSFGVILHHG
jgi:hypothetical protein